MNKIVYLFDLCWNTTNIIYGILDIKKNKIGIKIYLKKKNRYRKKRRRKKREKKRDKDGRK